MADVGVDGPRQNETSLHNPLVVLAALEAVIGFGYGDKGSKGTIVSNMNSITRNNFIHFIRDDQANCNHLSCWTASLAIYFYRLAW